MLFTFRAKILSIYFDSSIMFTEKEIEREKERDSESPIFLSQIATRQQVEIQFFALSFIPGNNERTIYHDISLFCPHLCQNE